MIHLNNKEFTIAAISVVILLSSAPITSLADKYKEPDYTSQKAWQGGMQSGSGNFIANCVTCHGPQGKGDGVLADALEVKPGNLSNKSIMSARSDEYLFKVIKQGGISVGLSDSMPLWGTTFSDVEIKNVIQYIRSEICKCKYSGGK